MQELKNIARRSVKLSAFVMIPLLFGIASVANPLILLLLTDKWLPSVPFLMLFCLLRIPGIFMSIDKQVYYAIGRSDINLYYEVILCLFNLIGLFMAVKYGVIWIAVCACVMEYFGLFAIFILSSRLYKYSISERLSDIWKSTIASIIMVMFVMVIPQCVTVNLIAQLILQILVGQIIYILVSLLLKNENVYYIKSLILNKRRHD